jgi:restriction system protein
MALWLERAGPHGEQERGALDHSVATIGWNEIPDISKIKNREELKELYQRYNPDAKKMRAARMIGQMWDFANEIKKGDIIALPLKSQSSIVLGSLEGDYEFKEISPTIKHIRQVKWLRTVPRSEFDQDLLFSLGAFSTVCEISRNNAEERIKKILQRRVPSVEGKQDTTVPSPIELNKTLDPAEIVDIEQQAKDRIVKYIAAKFLGHNLARLVEAILKAQGYITRNSEPGKDGGVDILAGSGPLGFNDPRICTQIKSSSSPLDVRVLRQLQGVMQRVNAKQGLLVAWGGFTKDAMEEARNLFFSIQLWDQGNLLDEVLIHFEQFDDELKAELPLKRIWTLVEEPD